MTDRPGRDRSPLLLVRDGVGELLLFGDPEEPESLDAAWFKPDVPGGQWVRVPDGLVEEVARSTSWKQAMLRIEKARRWFR
jgi:hypothetical protein